MAYRVALLFVLGLILVGSMVQMHSAAAETLVQSLVDSRISLAFRVNPAALQRWLPATWQSDPVASGPSKDANLMVTFVDRLLDLNAEGKPANPATYRVVALGLPAKDPAGMTASLSMLGFNSSPTGAPGFYKTAVPASVRREQTARGANIEPGAVGESWEMKDPKGEAITFKVDYQRGTPTRAKGEGKPRSAADPTIWRIYRFEQGVDVVMSVPEGINRTQNVQFRASGPELSKIFDGSEKLVSITAIPFYTRQTVLP